MIIVYLVKIIIGSRAFCIPLQRYVLMPDLCYFLLSNFFVVVKSSVIILPGWMISNLMFLCSLHWLCYSLHMPHLLLHGKLTHVFKYPKNTYSEFEDPVPVHHYLAATCTILVY